MVYIPHLRGPERLARALASLELQPEDHDVVVADNGHDGESAAMVAERFPTVTVIPMGSNLGFGRALNRAVREVPGDPIIFLNDDVQCREGFLGALLQAAETGVAAAAAVLVRSDRPDTIDSAGVIVESRTLMAFDHLHGCSIDVLAAATPPLGPTGGAALYSRSAFEAVGCFDENIFLYYEDVDLALRMRAAGFRCGLARDAVGLHEFSATLGATSGAKYEMSGWSRGYLLRRYGVLSSPASLVRAGLIESAVTAGQLLKDRTAGGIRGRIRGWKAGGGLPRLRAPTDSLARIGIREELAMRSGRTR